MKLYGSLTSPFVRVCRIAGIELGLDVEFEPVLVKPTQPNYEFGKSVNPLRRIPALLTDEGPALVDSRVILEYMNAKGDGSLIPSDLRARIACFNRYAVVSGATEALVSAMYEMQFRPEAYRWGEWAKDQVDKAHKALDWVEANADDFSNGFDIGTVGLAGFLGYAEFRFPNEDWLGGKTQVTALRASLMDRQSVKDTLPVD